MMKRNGAGAGLVFLWAWALIFVMTAVAQAAPPKRWSITEIGPQDNYTMASGVNNRGDVVGFSHSGDARGRAWLWQNGSTQVIGPATAFSSSAVDVNDHGAIVGTIDGNVHVWKDGTARALGFDGAPSAINKSGTVAGGRWTGPIRFGGQFRGFIFANGVLHELPTLGGDSSNVNDINDRGVAVGESAISFEGDRHAFIYENGVMTDLGTLGGDDSAARAVNNRGVVVGNSQTADGDFVAFIREPGQPMRQLLPAPSNAFAINDRGAVLGFVGTSAVLVDDGVVTRLAEIAEVRAAGWTHLLPVAINDRGWIVGYGNKAGDSRYHAFVLTPR